MLHRDKTLESLGLSRDLIYFIKRRKRFSIVSFFSLLERCPFDSLGSLITAVKKIGIVSKGQSRRRWKRTHA